MSILTVEKLSHGFGGREIFEDVSFRLLKGEHIGLVGANGEGKSTFMKIITNTLEPDQGKIIWSSKVKVGYLDQYMSVNKKLTIEDIPPINNDVNPPNKNDTIKTICDPLMANK